MYILCCDGIDTVKNLLQREIAAGIEEPFRHGQCVVLNLLGCDAQLPFPLSLGQIELHGSQLLLYQTANLLSDKTDASFPLLRFAGKIDGKQSGVTIEGHIRFHIVDQSVLLPEGGIETTIETVAPQDVIQQK